MPRSDRTYEWTGSSLTDGLVILLIFVAGIVIGFFAGTVR